MAVLKVKRPSPSASERGRRELLLGGKWLPVGTEFDTRDFPRVSKIPGKWAQLIRLGFLHDDHLDDPELASEVETQRRQFGSSELVADTRTPPVEQIDRYLTRAERAETAAKLEKPIGLQCGDCGFQATSQKGLRTHQTRKHKKE